MGSPLHHIASAIPAPQEPRVRPGLPLRGQDVDCLLLLTGLPQSSSRQSWEVCRQTREPAPFLGGGGRWRQPLTRRRHGREGPPQASRSTRCTSAGKQLLP